MARRYAILVIWPDGEEEYLKNGMSDTSIATFPNRQRADDQAAFMRMGMDDDVSIRVVIAPSRPRAAAASPTSRASSAPLGSLDRAAPPGMDAEA